MCNLGCRTVFVRQAWQGTLTAVNLNHLGAVLAIHTGSGEGSSSRPSGPAPAPPPVLCMLGYGSLAALANDPRVNPRAWQEGNDVDATHEQLQPNCGVSGPLFYSAYFHMIKACNFTGYVCFLRTDATVRPGSRHLPKLHTVHQAVRAG